MKKVFAVLMALTMLLSLPACGKKAETPAPGTSAQPQTGQEKVELPPELVPVEDVSLPAEEMEGRLPGGEYDLPEELSTMTEWHRDGAAALVAKQEDVAFYALEGKESNPALLCWGKSQAEFDWLYATPQAIEPDLWVYDIDGDGEDEVVVDCYGGSGTGVSLEYIYVVEKDEDGMLTSYGLSWDALRQAVDGQLQAVAMSGGTYAALGRELVDITAAVSESGAENVQVCLGQVAHYAQVDDGLSCMFGVVAEGEEIPRLSLYVATVEGEIRYENGVFTLGEMHLMSD